MSCTGIQRGVVEMRTSSITLPNIPLNKTLVKEKERLDTFSDEETDLIFKKVPLEELPENMRTRLIDTELDDCYSMLVRNLSVLIK